jgi:hypothetical protein
VRTTALPDRRHLDLYDASIYARHTLTTIPGAGHGARATYTSPEGREVLFGTGADGSDPEEPDVEEPVLDATAPLDVDAMIEDVRALVECWRAPRTAERPRSAARAAARSRSPSRAGHP